MARYALPEKARPRLHVLLADDSASIQTLIAGYLEANGHKVACVEDGASALVYFREHIPDVVLLDVVMPVMDGIETTRRLRSEAGSHWVPIILLSSRSAESDVLAGLEAGADDYLTKPLHLSVLESKLRSFQRIVAMQAEIRRQAQRLERLQEEQRYEHELAAALIEKIVHHDGLEDPALDWHVLPSSQFSGDVVAATRAPNGTLYAMLGDATGHGLTASVSLIPALQIFYGMSRKGLPLTAIVQEINRRLREQLPVGRYLAGALLQVPEQRGPLRCWNGGMPSGMILGAGGEVKTKLDPRHLALGILTDADFDSRLDEHAWSPGDEIVFVSDGVTEAENAAREPFGMARLHDALRRSDSGARAAGVVSALRAHLAGCPIQDDASILTVRLR